MPLREVTAGDERALQEIADALAKSHKQLVITGAGISTSCGIPDFRSKDGLYNLIPSQVQLPTPPSSQPSTPSGRKRRAYTTDDDDPPSSQSLAWSAGSLSNRSSPSSRLRGQDLFHARVFQSAETTTGFYQFIAALRQKIQDDVKDTSATHKFIRTLRDGGRLMRCYTQNIDGLEATEGLSVDLARGRGNKRRFMKKHYGMPRPQNVHNTELDGGCEVVQLHGELNNLRCRMCSSESEWSNQSTEIFLQGYAPKCEACVEKSVLRQATGKRGLTIGELRPNIVLYGEDHPQNSLLTPLISYDVSCRPDLLIIMGTSLKVHGLQRVVRDFAKAVHNEKNGRVIFINRTRPAESVWDGIIDDYVAMDCDDWVRDLRTRREDLWYRQGELALKQSKTGSRGCKRKVGDKNDPTSNERSKKQKLQFDIPDLEDSLTGQQENVPVDGLEDEDQDDNDDEEDNSLTRRATRWKTPRPDECVLRNVLSPLMQACRPEPSPLKTHFKSQQCAELRSDGGYVPGSPCTPLFSPLRQIDTTQFGHETMQQATTNDSPNTPSPRREARTIMNHTSSPGATRLSQGRNPSAGSSLRHSTTAKTGEPKARTCFETDTDSDVDPDLEPAGTRHEMSTRKLAFVNANVSKDEEDQPIYAQPKRGLGIDRRIIVAASRLAP